ncbi:MAG TPA: hydroxyphenylacetyl-CoA thioesterase PaaI [Rhizomicrobium sp.]|nr:hydroxyphenylacetyl-CoA thioesterase PaaI [Rhizomicrobium sp.]
MSTSSPDEDALALRVSDYLHSREGTSLAWDVEIEAVGPGFARVAMILRKDMLNGQGIAHGGMIFALADTAFAYACNSRNTRTVAQSATIAFMAPGREGDRLVAEAREQVLRGRSGVYAVEVKSQTGEIIAIFQGLSRSTGESVLPGIN